MTKRLEKAADPAKSLTNLQTLRDEAETNGDLEGAALYTQAIALLLQASGEAGESADQPPEEPSEAEPSDETGESAAGEAAAEAPGEDPRLELAAQGAPLAQAQSEAQPLRKAGRTFSASNQAAMHKVIQALAAILAGSGDAAAAAVLKCYGAGDQESAPQPKTAAAGLALDDRALHKAVADSPALAQVTGALEKMTQTVADLAERIEKYEAQPAPGGPALRQVVDKTLPLGGGEDQGKKPAEAQITTASLSDLRKAAALEPNPIIRAGLERQLKQAEAAYRAHS